MAEQQKHIVRHPGGVILHLSDGSGKHFEYGQEVNPDELAEYQRETLSRFTDEKDRSAYRRVEPDAHRNAAFADSGQINSTSDPVPGNYGELSEEDAAQLVLAMSGDSEIQARLLLHERLHHGSRQMVIDAGNALAVAIAETLFKHIEDGGHARFDQTPIIDRERQVEREARSSEKKDSGDKQPSKSSGGKTPAPNGG